MYAYDVEHRLVATTEPRFARATMYADAIKATQSAKAHWRFDETSGNALDAVGSFAATVSGASRGKAAALVTNATSPSGAGGASYEFDGTNDVVTAPTTLAVSSSYSVEAWIRPDLEAVGTSTALVGSRNGTDFTFDAKLHRGAYSANRKVVRIDIGNGGVGGPGTWLLSGNVPFEWLTGRWYHLVVAVDGAADVATVYVDGSPIGSLRFTTAGTPVLADSGHALKWGNNGGTGEWWDGRIDEPAVYTWALRPYQVRSHYLAGRGMVEQTTAATYDSECHPTHVQDVFARNGGFEGGLENWGPTSTASAHQASGSGDPDVRTGFGSLALTTTGEARQDVSLLPGQRFRLQLWSRSASATNKATVRVYAWDTATQAWALLLGADSATTTAWIGRAWDLTIPLANRDGRIRIFLNIDDDIGTVFFDDVTVLTSWSRTTWAANGTPANHYVLTPANPDLGVATADATVRTLLQYTAGASHPAIFPTRSIASYVDGVYNPSYRDRDLITDTTYDAWGRPLTVTDPDGVTATTHYDATSDTYVDWTEDGLSNRTSFTHDAVGNRLSVEDPLDRMTSTTYNLDSSPVTITDPAGIVTRHEYDTFGPRMASYANWVDGIPPAGSETTSDEDVKTSYGYDGFGRVVSTVADDGTFTGAIKAKTTSSFDQLGNAVASTTYADTAYAQPRTTTGHFETSVFGGPTLSRPKPSGVQLPIAPTAAPAPYCPGSTSTRCSAAPRWDASSTSATTVDHAGVAWLVSDAYGVRTVTDADLAGRPVRTIANWGNGTPGPNPDDDVTTSAEHDLAGRALRTVDASGLVTENHYDLVGRLVEAVDTAGISVTTVYHPSGRVERTSRPAAEGTAETARDWTLTTYDAAGRAVRTIDALRLDDTAGVVLETFEDADTTGWSTDGALPFIEAGGSLVNSGCGTCLMHTGARSGYLVTDGALDNEGAVYAVDAELGGYGSVFKAGAKYGFKLWAKSAVSGETVHLGVYLGVNGTAGNHDGIAVPALGTSWTPVTFDWTNTTGADQSTVYFAIRNNEPQARTIRFDDLQIWRYDDVSTSTVDERMANIPISLTRYDGAGQIVRTVAPPHLPGDDPLVTATTYDAAGRISAVTVNAITMGSTSDTVTNLTTTTAYDDLGRATSAVDPRGVTTAATYDRLGRTTKTILNYVNGTPTDGPTVDDDAESRFAYNAVGEMVGFCSAAQVLAAACDATNPTSVYAWHYEFDALGRMTKQVPPDNATLTDLDTTLWSYETGGRLGATCTVAPGTTSCTASGSHRRTTFAYDDLGRETTGSVYSGSSAGTLRTTTTTTYNADQLVASVAFVGTAGWNETAGTALNEGTDTLTYTYDAFDRPDQIKRSSTVLTDYGYAADGNLASRVDGTTGTLSFTYDWADRPFEVTSALFSGKVTQAYGLDELLDQRILPSSSGTDTLAYDAAKRPTAINRSNGDSLTRTYDRAGNVTSDGRSIAGAAFGGDLAGGTQTYSYDNLDRVTGASGLGWGSGAYEYDLDGNRTKSTEAGVTTTYLYDRADQLKQQTIGPTTTAFVYDTQGNMTTKAESVAAVTSALQYDTANRLVKMTDGPSSATYTLDALGRTKSRVIGATTDQYAYVGESETAHQVTTGATITNSIVGSDGGRLAVLSGTTLNWYLFDLHGDAAGQVASGAPAAVRAYRYRPFGEAISPQGSGLASPWGYQGALSVSPNIAASHALLDIGARFYAPSLGAWTQLDTFAGSVQNPLSMNRFLYVEGNPTTLVDPTGHASIPSWQLCPYGPEDCADLPDYDAVAHGYGDLDGSNPSSNSGSSTGGLPPTIYLLIDQPTSPAPAPAPCGGPSPTPCPTPAPAFPTTPGDFDPSGAALAGCSALAPPPWQWGCDAEDIRRSAEQGDAVGVLLGGIGLVPYGGDAIKWFLKSVRSVDDDAIRLLRSGRPADLVVGGLSRREALQADEFLSLRGGRFEGLPKGTEGIDGLHEGIGVSLKQVDSARPETLINDVAKGGRQVADANAGGAQLWLTARAFSSADVASMVGTVSRHSNKSIAATLNPAMFSVIYVRTSDGWLVITA